MSQATIEDVDFLAIRQGLRALPRADNVNPGDTVVPEEIVAVGEHRSALDPERTLVVGNRGMGKSFWTHALANPSARAKMVSTFRLPELDRTDVCIGFNASDRLDRVAPTPSTLRDALRMHLDADAVWRAVLLRAVSNDPALPATFAEVVSWVLGNVERTERLLTEADERLATSGRRLLVVFDALDRLAGDWKTTRTLTKALLQRALAVRSYRAIRLKLFMRTDQYADSSLFEFPDGSKIRNTRVDLSWSSGELYALLFHRLARSPIAAQAFEVLTQRVREQSTSTGTPQIDGAKPIVDALAGEFMGANAKRGVVFTWLPLHLADANRETSPRTFLTAWRVAALHEGSPSPITGRAVDHLGLLEGVRKASEDRLQELREDYWWIDAALAPLHTQMVPMERATLEALWQRDDTAARIIQASREKARLAPVQFEDGRDPVAALLVALASIGVMESRSNGKIDVPDIFRVEAGIKRKGGVKPPRRSRSEGP